MNHGHSVRKNEQKNKGSLGENTLFCPKIRGYFVRQFRGQNLKKGEL